MVALGLVIAQFDKQGSVVPRMEEAALEAAADRGAEVVATLEVPGTFDTPLAADRLARRGDIDAVAVLGNVVTGDTDHDQVIAHTAGRQLSAVSVDRDTPVTFGVTGPDQSAAEAVERVEWGARAVDSAVDLAEQYDAVEERGVYE
jgi:6,7-dimethyl-8-ribityllumazine synthase